MELVAPSRPWSKPLATLWGTGVGGGAPGECGQATQPAGARDWRLPEQVACDEPGARNAAASAPSTPLAGGWAWRGRVPVQPPLSILVWMGILTFLLSLVPAPSPPYS